MNTKIKTENGIKYVKTEKWKLMSSHIGRRTFITISIINKIPPNIIMKVSGHKQMQSFQKYIKIIYQDISTAFNEAYENF